MGGPVVTPAAVAAGELTECVLRWFLRGGTWPGLAREIAWQAVLTAGVEDAWTDWLTQLVEERLAERVDRLELEVARACAGAGSEHLRLWPHDFGGGETAAVLEGQERAARELAELYLETRAWALELVHQRTQLARHARKRLRLRTPGHARAPTRVDPPPLVAELVERPPRRYGWARRRST